jgi:hypothetical protein
MSSEIEVRKAMERNLEGMQAFASWTIGLAQEPDARERDLDYPAFWRFWNTDTHDQAVSVKSYFLEKGMRDDGEHGRHPTHVYLF